MASREPVEAPDGTAARPMVPDSSSTSHSTVGLPRLSRISRPTMSTIALIFALSLGSDTLDDDHAHDRRALTRRARLAVLGRVVEFLRLLDARKLEDHDALGMPVALEHLDLAAAHADFGAMDLHG